MLSSDLAKQDADLMKIMKEKHDSLRGVYDIK